ncbi:Imm10 family immunity protein [Saccharothrix isguenensis]
MLRTTVRFFGYVEDDVDEVVEIGLAESDDGAGFVLLIQRTDYEPDEQDIALGMDTYCLVSGGRTHYGGVLRAARDGNTLHLRIAADAASLLDLPEQLAITLDGPADDVAAFFTGLPGVLDWGRPADRPVLVNLR